ncbi:MAG: hypothetical protein LBR70_05410 [Lactobacillaceae bacterium]|jgi:Ca2+-binding EF-hand superfamily protein|nr:hypothetical protein [Lactobacillaceae bacterium]
MKKVVLIALFALFGFSQAAEAKYNPPADVTTTRSDIIASRYMSKFGEKRDGKLEMSFDDYMRRPLTREDRRNMRRDEKDGVFLPDKQRFDAIDTNKDGYVDQEELSNYIRGLRDKGRNFY